MAYEMRISDWSSDVFSSDLHTDKAVSEFGKRRRALGGIGAPPRPGGRHLDIGEINHIARPELRLRHVERQGFQVGARIACHSLSKKRSRVAARDEGVERSEEHTSELQSLMRISYAVFC